MDGYNFGTRGELRRRLMQNNEKLSLEMLTLPLDTYRTLEREHQFAVEFVQSNPASADLKVLDDSDESGAYHVYAATVDGTFIDAWGVYDDEQKLLQQYRLRRFRGNLPVPSRLVDSRFIVAKNLRTGKLKPFITDDWDSNDIEIDDDFPEESELEDDYDADGEYVDLSVGYRDIINTSLLEGILDKDNQAWKNVDESNRLFRERGQSEAMRALDLQTSWFDSAEKEICLSCGEFVGSCKRDGMRYGCKPRKYPKRSEGDERWAIVRKRKPQRVEIEMEPGSSLEDARARKESYERYQINSFFEGDVKWMQNSKGDVFPVLRSTGQRIASPEPMVIKKIISGGSVNSEGEWQDYKLSRRAYRRNLNGSKFVGTQSTFTKDKARAIAGWVRNNNDLNARVIPSSNGYRIYLGKRMAR